MAYYISRSYKLRVEPWLVFEVLKHERNCFFLDSSLNSNYAQGRYSFLGIDPFFTLKTKNEDPFEKIREILGKYRISGARPKLPFSGGAVGYLAYDLGLILEKKISSKTKVDLGIPDCFFGFYNSIVIIDHIKNLLYIFSIGFPEKSSCLAKLLAESNFKKIYQLLSKIGLAKNYKKTHGSKVALPQLNSNFTREEYLSAIKKAKEYIKEGDIYQVNLSQMFNAKSPLSGHDIYQRLRKISPSYFSAYLDLGGFQILSSSPERFLKLEGERVVTCPMKGTRPRSKNRLNDRKLKKELLESAKDKAELLMIVDLERNDLGRVCSYDSIRVETLRQLEEYSTVFQTTACVQGRLHKNKDRMDLLRACFPGGSITGCPKIRAMEIIDELEPARRLVYTGSLGYLSFCGSMDFNILIRTILKKDNKLYFSVGGGIVADSKPEEEYQETLVKARGMIEAIGG
jgi:para-aminobenzoate synthetase component 1